MSSQSGADHIPDSIMANTTMKTPFLERVWAWLHETFPERQIYIRSDGRVQFFTFSASLQATLAGLALIFLGWVAFATVNVVFKDRIITAKDHRYQQMQQAYEGRVANLQMSYDQLNGALVSAEDRFKATADALQIKQNAITGFLNKAARAEQDAGLGHTPPGSGSSAQPTADAHDDGVASDSLGIEAPAGYFDGSAAGSSQLAMLPGPALPQPRIAARSDKPNLLQRAWTSLKGMFHLAATDVRQAVHPPKSYAGTYSHHPVLQALDQQTKRVARIGQSETVLMAKTEARLDKSVSNLRAVVQSTGINPDQFIREADKAANKAMGGPEIPLSQVHIEGISDPGFTQTYLDAAVVLDKLNALSSALSHVPLVRPVPTADFARSSGFGVRLDPFTGRYAFHPGIDFAGPKGAVVHATAPGTVVFAGLRGGYGRMVEINHGFGIHTRYGHLSKISVKTGEKVTKGETIGRVGSTGRSTGPHVHYEVLYDNTVKNPRNFIEAGRHVL
jgi:murein DD-endopeptidase MepM/ murein hydrolase activator NlpD